VRPHRVRSRLFPYARSGSDHGSWQGTVLVDKPNATGTYYRRNRNYDHKSARFTTPDPIGIAGGLNAYGFASGDPVNFSDPLGLCTDSNGKSIPQDQCEAVSAAQGKAIYAAAEDQGQWTYTEGKTQAGEIPKNFCEKKGDCTDFVEASMEGAGLPTLSPRPATGQFAKSADYELVTGAPQAGDVIVQGGHAGIFSGAYDGLHRPLGIQNGGNGTKVIPWGKGVRGLANVAPVFYRRLVPTGGHN